eukprot:1158335-Pelagomonas_calceolata.AAC.1
MKHDVREEHPQDNDRGVLGSQVAARLCDHPVPCQKVAMMFVRCRGGISHSPLEHTEPKDVAAASAALATFIAGRVLPSGYRNKGGLQSND